MKINDPRPRNQFDVSLRFEGISKCGTARVGDVVQMDDEFYLLCSEAAHSPMICGTGPIRFFLVNLATGRRVPHPRDMVLNGTRVEASVTIEGGQA